MKRELRELLTQLGPWCGSIYNQVSKSPGGCRTQDLRRKLGMTERLWRLSLRKMEAHKLIGFTHAGCSPHRRVVLAGHERSAVELLKAEEMQRDMAPILEAPEGLKTVECVIAWGVSREEAAQRLRALHKAGFIARTHGGSNCLNRWCRPEIVEAVRNSVEAKINSSTRRKRRRAANVPPQVLWEERPFVHMQVSAADVVMRVTGPRSVFDLGAM